MLNGFINSTKILNYLNFYIPQCQTRSTNTFYMRLYRINYLANAPINRVLKLANDMQIHLFHFNSIESFYNFILKHYK